MSVVKIDVMQSNTEVLILILLEDGQWVEDLKAQKTEVKKS